MRYLTIKQILELHSMIIQETGGSHGVRDLDLIASLEQLPRQSFFGKELYPILFIKAVLYTRNIITGHPFIDGNKRTAILATESFLYQNGYQIIVSEGEIEKIALRIIEESLSLQQIAKWLKQHTKKST